MQVPLEIGTQSNYARYGQGGAARLINCYAEELGAEGKHPRPIYAAAGLSDFATLTNGGAVRAMLDVDGYLYAVAGRAIYRVSTSGIGGAAPIGGMPSDGFVTMARNRRSPVPQIAVVSDGLVKVIQGTSVVDLGDSDLPPPSSVFFFGGYFIFTTTSGRFYWSGIDDTSIDALDFASAEGNADGIVIGKPLGPTAVFLGERSTEFWALVGGETVFARQHIINVGCFAGGSAAEVPIITPAGITDSLAFAATDRFGSYAGVCVIENLNARKISNHAVDRSIRDEPDRSSITACSWSDGGHAFYSISGSTFSWCWDSATGQWHERRSYGLERWKVRSVTNLGGRLIAGDYTSNKLYVMSSDYVSEAGQPLILTIQTPPVSNFPHSVTFNRADLDIVPGVGLENGADHNVHPEAMFSWSDDGINFGSRRQIAIGRMGETVKRISTHRLGQMRYGAARTFRLDVSADVVKAVLGLSLDVEGNNL